MRTNVFLVVNGLGAVAAGVSQSAVLLIGTVVIVANVLWLGCSLLAYPVNAHDRYM